MGGRASGTVPPPAENPRLTVYPPGWVNGFSSKAYGALVCRQDWSIRVAQDTLIPRVGNTKPMHLVYRAALDDSVFQAPWPRLFTERLL